MSRTMRLITVSLLAALLTASMVTAQPARGTSPTIDAKIQAEIIDSVTTALNEVYVFPDVAKEMEKFVRKQLKDKAYQEATTTELFADALTRDLREISKDKHLRVAFMSDQQLERIEGDTITDEDIERRRAELAYNNFEWHKLERLSGNVGYVDLRGFEDAEFGGATAVAAMNFLANCDAVIFDLRQNGGGSPSMIQLITSYFFDEPVHLNSFYVRAQDTIQQFWTQAHIQGPRLTDVDLYVLTSGYTFSAAEEFTYNLKNLERATIVGETTGGGAHPVNRHFFANVHIMMSLPFGRAINPITGTNWEGVGVEPDIAVPQEQALEVAHLEALKKLAKNETREDIKFRLDWDITTMEALANPAPVDPSLLQSYAGVYGPRIISFEDGELFYQREGRPKYRMIPMNDDTFVFEDIDFFRLQVVKNEQGEITHLQGIYADGHRDMSPKGPGK